MFSLYSEKEIFEEIILMDEYPNWNKIVSENTEVCLNITDEQLEAELSDENSPLFVFLHSTEGAKIPIALSEYFDELTDDLSLCVDHPRSAFILKVSEAEAKSAQENYGMAIFSNNQLPDTYLSGGFFKELMQNEVVDGGWKSLINTELPVSNSLVISDNFLFENTEAEKNLGVENVVDLLNAVLPQNLGIDYHVTVLAPDAGKSKNHWIKEVGKLKLKVQSLREFTINFEIVFSNAVHKRRIIFNYLNGWSDKGFSMFKNSNKNVIRGDNDIHLHRVFSNVFDDGDSFYKSSENGLNKITKICSDVTEFVRARGQTQNKMIFGDCYSNKKVKNRLLN